ncbi:MAG: pentapeptide repeat-containing protein [Chlorobiaceae bacterium]|nr:pentapeptide repeat-containing protein [Chlorobiaceae bacterium]
MNRIISELVENRVFEGLAFTENMLEKAIYEDCSFIRCNFNASDLSGSIFRNCRFVNCDLSLAKLRDTGFQEVHFSGCKLLGTVFSDCSKLLFEAGFEHCMMKLSSFQKMKLRNTVILKCDLREADFSETDLSCSTFAECDLLLAIFHHTNLEGADLRTAFNFSISPENNRLRKARFSADGLPGLLDSYGIVID